MFSPSHYKNKKKIMRQDWPDLPKKNNPHVTFTVHKNRLGPRTAAGWPDAIGSQNKKRRMSAWEDALFPPPLLHPPPPPPSTSCWLTLLRCILDRSQGYFADSDIKLKYHISQSALWQSFPYNLIDAAGRVMFKKFDSGFCEEFVGCFSILNP